jgi:hypothetical protein
MFMMALGFNYEHLRSDRDDSIVVNLNNIRDRKFNSLFNILTGHHPASLFIHSTEDRIFFAKLTDAVLPRFSQPYDYDSVM